MSCMSAPQAARSGRTCVHSAHQRDAALPLVGRLEAAVCKGCRVVADAATTSPRIPCPTAIFNKI